MKKSFIATAAALAFFASAANAEDRLVAGYSFPAVSYSEGVWAAGVEKDLGKLGNVTLFAGADYARAQNTDFADSQWGATFGVQVPLSDAVNFKADVTRSFVSDVDDVDSLSVGLVYQGDKWRFDGAAVKAEGRDVFANVSAERKVLGNLALGVGSQFDAGEYYATAVFASYSF
jgi:hypothetical protein